MFAEEQVEELPEHLLRAQEAFERVSQQIDSLRSSRLRSSRGESLGEAKEELRQGLEALRQSRLEHLKVREEIFKDLEGLEMLWDRRVVPSG